jgi:hypothetical protein
MMTTVQTKPMNTTQTTFKTTNDAVPFIDWLAASARLDDLRWVNDLGATVYTLPSDDLFMGAAESLADGWEALTWADQRFCVCAAADWLAEIEAMVAEVS